MEQSVWQHFKIPEQPLSSAHSSDSFLQLRLGVYLGHLPSFAGLLGTSSGCAGTPPDPEDVEHSPVVFT
jgi:hypothetical protein